MVNTTTSYTNSIMVWKEGNRVLLKRTSGAWSEGIIVPGRKGHIGVRCIDNGVAREKHIPIDRMEQFVKDVFSQSEMKRRQPFPKIKRRFSCALAVMDKMLEHGQLTVNDEIQYGDHTPHRTCKIIKKERRGTPLHFVVDNTSGQVYGTLNMWAVKEYNDKSKKAIHQCYRKRSGTLTPVIQLREELEAILQEKDQYHRREEPTNSDIPLVNACKSGNVDLLKVLLTMKSTGCNPHTITSTGDTPLGIAAATGQCQVIHYLLRYKLVDPNVASLQGRTPLHVACSNGHYESAVALLRHSGPNKKDYSGKTPFYVACEKGHTKIVKLLLSKDEVIRDVVPNNKKTPFYAAVAKGHRDVVSLLCGADDVDHSRPGPKGQTPIYKAAKKGFVEVVRQLLTLQKSSVNISDARGNTPLIAACEKGHVDVAELLIQHSETNINVVNNQGESPIFIASQKGNRRLVEMLLDWNTTRFSPPVPVH
eukprot:TRINITY_DN4597_c1_g1_i1.p1 TRINITY_DN4597_c1_g1~~TRINITY_DN4597_c1_g1_i1.p1  ORF type:complete len:478 (+),score=60.52 TRINITY_DN4597_c1_g1_i1:179-1612(+)